MVADPIITMADFRRVFCVAGTASRMRDAGIDLRVFVQQGLPVSQLRNLGYDALIDRVLAAKESAELMSVTVPVQEG